MRGVQTRGALVSACLAFIGWGVGRIVEPLAWLPYVAVPLGILGLIVCGVWQAVEVWRDRTRRSLPGVGAHMQITIREGQAGRRRYIFDAGEKKGAGASLYISASERFVFEVRDRHGEPYSIELPIGRRGVPLSEPVFLAVEAGADAGSTDMRVLLDAKIVGQRTLPFEVDFSGIDVRRVTVGADANGTAHSAYIISAFSVSRCTFTDKQHRAYVEAMTTYLRSVTRTPA